MGCYGIMTKNGDVLWKAMGNGIWSNVYWDYIYISVFFCEFTAFFIPSGYLT